MVAHHPIGLLGLTFNTVSAIGLIYFTRDPDAKDKIGWPPATRDSLRAMFPEVRRAYVREIRGYKVSFALLIVGFVLQAIDLYLG